MIFLYLSKLVKPAAHLCEKDRFLSQEKKLENRKGFLLYFCRITLVAHMSDSFKWMKIVSLGVPYPSDKLKMCDGFISKRFLRLEGNFAHFAF